MGTLGHQPERHDIAPRHFRPVLNALELMGVDRDNATPAQWQAAAAVAHAALACQDGDYRDEQAGGFSDHAEGVISALRDLVEAIRAHAACAPIA